MEWRRKITKNLRLRMNCVHPFCRNWIHFHKSGGSVDFHRDVLSGLKSQKQMRYWTAGLLLIRRFKTLTAGGKLNPQDCTTSRLISADKDAVVDTTISRNNTAGVCLTAESNASMDPCVLRLQCFLCLVKCCSRSSLLAALICIDSVSSTLLFGRLYNPYSLLALLKHTPRETPVDDNFSQHGIISFDLVVAMSVMVTYIFFSGKNSPVNLALSFRYWCICGLYECSIFPLSNPILLWGSWNAQNSPPVEFSVNKSHREICLVEVLMLISFVAWPTQLFVIGKTIE
ncbi:hypothetical protein Tco_1176917 [Tanacetum coccineum]